MMQFPNLVLAFRDCRTRCDRLTLMEFDPQAQAYIELGDIPLAGSQGCTDIQIVAIARTPQHIFVGLQPRRSGDRTVIESYVVKLDLNGIELKRVAFKNLAALERTEDHLFISAEGDFIVLNFDLEILDRAELMCFGGKKNAHDIFIHQGIAYLLDNLEFPVFIFKFDCSNPGGIMLLERHEIVAPYPHLDAQWLDPENQRWYILATEGGRGYGQYLYVTEASSQPAWVKFQVDGETTVETVLGLRNHKILAASALTPPWVVVSEGPVWYGQTPGKLYLATLVSDRTHVRLEPCLDLYPLLLAGDEEESFPWDDDFSHVVLQKYGHYLLLVTSRHRRICLGEGFYREYIDSAETIILVIDCQDQPTVAFQQNIELDHQRISRFVQSESI